MNSGEYGFGNGESENSGDEGSYSYSESKIVKEQYKVYLYQRY